MARTSLVHYISPSAISIIPNCNSTPENPNSNDLAVQVGAGTKIRVYSMAIEGLGMVNATYREWTLKGRNRRLLPEGNTDRWTIFARLAKDNVGDGYIVFTPITEETEEGGTTVGKDKYWHVTTEGYSRYEDDRLDEDFDPDDPDIDDPQQKQTQKDYWFIRIGWVSEPDANNLRTVYLDTGILGTDEGDETNTEEMMKRKYVTIDWFKRIFTIHGTDRKRVVDHYDADGNPVYEVDPVTGEEIWEGTGERRDIKPNDMDHEITDTESMFGTWTEQWLSALGIGSGGGGGGGGGGGDALDEPLLSINQMVATPTQQQIGYTLVWKGNNAGINNSGWDFGQAGMSRQEIQTLCDSLYLKLNSPSTPQTVTSDITLTGNLTINRTPITDFTGKENYVLTLRETETYFGNKYVRVDWFKKVFETYTGTTKHDPNDAGVIAGTTVLDNLKILVGTWTEQYLSALGIGSGGGGGGGGAGLDDPLLSINAIGSNPSDANQTLVFDGSRWTYGSAGLDTTELAQYLSTNNYLTETGLTAYKWWGQQFSANNKTIKGKIEVEGNIEKVHNIIPLNNNLYTIGNSNYRFKAIYVNEIYVGDAKISWNSTNHGLHLTKGAYTDEWLAALGAGSGGSGGGGGIDWEALTYWDQDPAHVINQHYLDLTGMASQSWVTQNFNNYTHPTNGANTTITAANKRVLSSITVNDLGHVTAVGSKDLTDNDIPELAASKITSGTLDAARIPDLDWSKITTGKPNTLTGYGIVASDSLFDEITAGSAAKLTTVSKTAWGRTYWTANGVPTDISGDIDNAENVRIANDKRIYFKDNVGNGTDISCVTMDTSNNLVIGEGQCNASTNNNYHRTYIRGYEVVMQYGTASGGTAGARLDKNGMFIVKKLKIGNIIISDDTTNGGLHVENAGIYADTYVSSLGTGSGGSAAGIDLEAMWNSLSTNTDTYGSTQIHSDHLTTALTGYLKQNDADLRYLKLSGGTMANTNLVTNMNADLLDGYHANEVVTLYGGTQLKPSETNIVDLDSITTIGNYYCSNASNANNYVTNKPSGFSGAFRLVVGRFWTGERYMYQRIHSYNTTQSYERINTASSVSWGAWTLVQDDLSLYAKKTDAASSADALSTPRSLWGNSFDGSADVSGNITMKDSGSRYHVIYVKQNGTDNRVGYLAHDSGDETNVTASRWFFAEYSPKTTADTGTTGKYERYFLPQADKDLSANADYYILTNKNFTLTGDLTGSLTVGSNGSVSLSTSIGTGKVTSAMLEGSIANSKLANSSITIDGTSVSLGESYTSTKWGPSRTITIKDNDETNSQSNTSIDGSADFTLKLPATIKASLTGTASKATRLASDDTKSAWGMTYWSGGKPQAISGNMTDVGNISFSASGKNIGGVAYFDTTNTRLGIGAAPGAYALDVSGDIHTSGDSYIDSGKALICKISSSSTKKLLEFDGTQVTLGYGFRSSNETRIYGKNIGMYYGTTLKVQVTTDGLKIGDITIKNENGGLHVIGGGLYTDTYLSALGTGSGGSGGGGTVLSDPLLSINNSSLGSPAGHSNNTFIYNGSSWVWSGSEGATLNLFKLGAGTISCGGTIQGSTISGTNVSGTNVSGTNVSVSNSLNVGGSEDGNKLYVYGNFSLGGGVGKIDVLNMNVIASQGITFKQNSTSTSLLSLDFTNSAVGIGTSAQIGYKLYVNGKTNINGDVDITKGKTIYFQHTASGVPEISIGTKSNDQNLYLKGVNLYFNGSIISSSDMRLKDVDELVDGDIESIARAPIFYYRWKKTPEFGPHLGSSAQYWQNVFSCAVVKDEEGYLGLDYAATALAAAVMTARKVVDHEERIAKLEAENKSIKAENEQLRHEIELLKAA